MENIIQKAVENKFDEYIKERSEKIRTDDEEPRQKNKKKKTENSFRKLAS